MVNRSKQSGSKDAGQGRTSKRAEEQKLKVSKSKEEKITKKQKKVTKKQEEIAEEEEEDDNQSNEQKSNSVSEMEESNSLKQQQQSGQSVVAESVHSSKQQILQVSLEDTIKFYLNQEQQRHCEQNNCCHQSEQQDINEGKEQKNLSVKKNKGKQLKKQEQVKKNRNTSKKDEDMIVEKNHDNEEQGSDDDIEESEEEEEEVESIAQRKGKRNVMRKFEIKRGAYVQIEDQEDKKEIDFGKKQTKKQKKSQIEQESSALKSNNSKKQSQGNTIKKNQLKESSKKVKEVINVSKIEKEKKNGNNNTSSQKRKRNMEGIEEVEGEEINKRIKKNDKESKNSKNIDNQKEDTNQLLVMLEKSKYQQLPLKVQSLKPDKTQLDKIKVETKIQDDKDGNKIASNGIQSSSKGNNLKKKEDKRYVDKNAESKEKILELKKKAIDKQEGIKSRKQLDAQKIERKIAKKVALLNNLEKKIESAKESGGHGTLHQFHSQCISELFDEGDTSMQGEEKQDEEDNEKIDIEEKDQDILNEKDLDVQKESQKKMQQLKQKGKQVEEVIKKKNNDGFEDYEKSDEEDEEDEEEDDDEEDEDEDESVQEIRKSSRRPVKPKHYEDFDCKQSKGRVANLEDMQIERVGLEQKIKELKVRLEGTQKEIENIELAIGVSTREIEIEKKELEGNQIKDLSKEKEGIIDKKKGQQEIKIRVEQTNDYEAQEDQDEELTDGQDNKQTKDEMDIEGEPIKKKRGRKPKNKEIIVDDQNEVSEQVIEGKKGRKKGKSQQSQIHKEVAGLNIMDLFFQEVEKASSQLQSRQLQSNNSIDQVSNNPSQQQLELQEQQKSQKQPQRQTLKDLHANQRLFELEVDSPVEVEQKDSGNIIDCQIELEVQGRENEVVEEEIQKKLDKDERSKGEKGIQGEIDGGVHIEQKVEIQKGKRKYQRQNAIQVDFQEEQDKQGERDGKQQEVEDDLTSKEDKNKSKQLQGYLAKNNEEDKEPEKVQNQENNISVLKLDPSTSKQQESPVKNKQQNDGQNTTKIEQNNSLQNSTINEPNTDRSVVEIEQVHKELNNEPEKGKSQIMQDNLPISNNNLEDITKTKTILKINSPEKKGKKSIEDKSLSKEEDSMSGQEITDKQNEEKRKQDNIEKQQFEDAVEMMEAELEESQQKLQKGVILTSGVDQKIDKDQQQELSDAVLPSTDKGFIEEKEGQIDLEVTKEILEKQQAPELEIKEKEKESIQQSIGQKQEDQHTQEQTQLKQIYIEDNPKQEPQQLLQQEQPKEQTNPDQFDIQKIQFHVPEEHSKQQQQLNVQREEQISQEQELVQEEEKNGEIVIEQEQMQSQQNEQAECFMNSDDQMRREFDEDNFFDDLTPISMPEESQPTNSDIDFNKIPQMRQLITFQQQQSQSQQQQYQQSQRSSQISQSSQNNHSSSSRSQSQQQQQQASNKSSTTMKGVRMH